MFGIAWSEYALIGAIALIVIGPKDLPRVLYTAGQWVRRARMMAAEFRYNVDDMIRQADISGHPAWQMTPAPTPAPTTPAPTPDPTVSPLEPVATHDPAAVLPEISPTPEPGPQP